MATLVDDDAFDALVQACLDNHEEIMRLGSLEMQAASRILLFALGKEIRCRELGEQHPAADGAPTRPPRPKRGPR
jgi:hypothetical protein